MLDRTSIGATVALAAALVLPMSAMAQDMSKYPMQWEGQWGRGPMRPGSWNPATKSGVAEGAPLTAEYQKVLEANVQNQKDGKDFDPKTSCYPPGMPRVMAIYQPMEIIIKPRATYFLLESGSPIRRIWTDGRSWPETMQPGFAGYSIGHWADEDGDGHYDTLYVETRGISGRRLFDESVPLADDDSTVVNEKISIDKAKPDLMNNEITTTDSALSKPWTVTRQYRRAKKEDYAEYNCEDKRNVVINGETYWIGLDGYLMPLAKNQPAPDLKYFKKTGN